MNFSEHVNELRVRILRMLLAVILCSVAGYFLVPRVFHLVSELLDYRMVVTEIPEAFRARFKASILIGIILALPVILYQAARFVFPALAATAARITGIALFFSGVLFVLGMGFGYRIVLPLCIRFLTGGDFLFRGIGIMIRYESFLMFFFRIVYGLALCFEFPVLLIILMASGVVKRRILTLNFRFFIVIALVVSALLTPPDVISQLVFAGPLIILYLVTLAVARLLKIGE